MKNMRNSKRQMSNAETVTLLETGEYGVLATCDSENQPYGLPISYALCGDVIYLHCAPEGHKLLNIAANEKVCFTVVGKTRVIPDKFTTDYESVVVFGKAAIVESADEKRLALFTLVQKYSPQYIAEGEAYLTKAFDRTTVVKIKIGHMTGKHRV